MIGGSGETPADRDDRIKWKVPTSKSSETHMQHYITQQGYLIRLLLLVHPRLLPIDGWIGGGFALRLISAICIRKPQIPAVNPISERLVKLIPIISQQVTEVRLFQAIWSKIEVTTSSQARACEI